MKKNLIIISAAVLLITAIFSVAGIAVIKNSSKGFKKIKELAETV
jgi:hypothetical protein